MIWAWWSALMHFSLWLWDIPDCIGHRGWAEERFLHVTGFTEGEMKALWWRGKGARRGADGKETNGVLYQKWSCAEESAGANEREDGKMGWLINLFTSLKTLQAPFWLKFRLPSIITNAGSSHWSCQHQMLWEPRRPPPPPHWPWAAIAAKAAITPRKIEPNTLSLGLILVWIFISSSCSVAEHLAHWKSTSVSPEVSSSVTL